MELTEGSVAPTAAVGTRVEELALSLADDEAIEGSEE